jgi:hypothetical protein
MADENSSKLQDSDILTFRNGKYEEYTYKYKNLKSSFSGCLQDGTINKNMKERNPPVIVGSNYWLNGIECELLRDGVEKKGKIKVTLEFVPDEIEVAKDSVISSEERSPLDDIRQINL